MYDGPTSELSTLPRDLTASGTSIPREKNNCAVSIESYYFEV